MNKLDGLNSKDFNNLISLSFLSEKIALNQWNALSLAWRWVIPLASSAALCVYT